MNLLNLFQRPDINQLAKEAQNDPEIALIDVRTDDEYETEHIPGSIHLELSKANELPDLIPDLEHKIYVYCHSGMRSEQACAIFQNMGYQNVTNIGGLASWKG